MQRPSRGGLMGAGFRKFVIALAVGSLFLSGLPPLQLHVLSVAAQTSQTEDDPNAFLDAGVSWSDVQFTTRLYLKTFTPTGTVGTPGQAANPLRMNSVPPSNSTAQTVVRQSVESPSPGGAAPTPPDAQKVYFLMEPKALHAFTVTELQLRIWFKSTTGVECFAQNQLNPESSDDIRFHAVAKIVSGTAEADLLSTGALLAQSQDGPGTDHCGGGDLPVAATVPLTLKPDTRVSADTTIVVSLWAEAIGQVSGAAETQWTLFFDGSRENSWTQVGSNDAVQVAAWVTAKGDPQITTIITLPPAGESARAKGHFAVKTAFGGYDNPRDKDVGDAFATKKANWDGSIRNMRTNTLVDLSDANVENCEGGSQKKSVCLDQIGRSRQASMRKFNMPGEIWSVFAGTEEGEYRFEVTGAMGGLEADDDRKMDNADNARARFRVGGLKVTLDTWPGESAVVQERVGNTMRPGSARGFVLNLTNAGGVTDTITLASEVLSPAGADWRVGFVGPNVTGESKATLGAGRSTLVVAKVVPPTGIEPGTPSASSRIRVTATSDSDRTINDLLELVTTVVAEAQVYGVRVLLVEPPSRFVGRGGTVDLNVSIWNRGNDRDNFNLTLDITPTPEWNVTLSVPRIENLDPGDVATVKVRVTAGVNLTPGNSIPIGLRAQSIGDGTKFDLCPSGGCLRVEVARNLGFAVKVMKVSNDIDDAFAFAGELVQRDMRLGKDNPQVCVPHDGDFCDAPPAGSEVDPPGEEPEDVGDDFDARYSTVAFYRIQIKNTGDVDGVYQARVSSNSTRLLPTDNSQCIVTADRNTNTNPFQRYQPLGDSEHWRAFMLVRQPRFPETNAGHADETGPTGNVLDFSKPENRINLVPGQEAFFYLRVWAAWNDYIADDGRLCAAESDATVDVESLDPDTLRVSGRQQVNAKTRTFGEFDSELPSPGADDFVHSRKILIETGNRTLFNLTGEPDVKQNCPPLQGNPPRFICKYRDPGVKATWQIHATVFEHSNESFKLKVERAGGGGLKPLQDLGWIFNLVPTAGFAQPTITCSITDFTCKSRDKVNMTGAEYVMTLEVSVPINATVNDVASLKLSGSTSGNAAGSLDIHTIAAQRFRVRVTNVTDATLQAHPGDLLAFALNISNDGSSDDVYQVNVTTEGGLSSLTPQGIGLPSFSPVQVPVAAGANVTATVFVPVTTTSPLSGDIDIKVASLNNDTTQRACYFVPQAVAVDPAGNVNCVRLHVEVVARSDQQQATDLKLSASPQQLSIEPGRDATFTLTVTNPSASLLPGTVLKLLGKPPAGWDLVISQTRFDVPPSGDAGNPKSVPVTVIAPPDAKEPSFASFIVRVESGTNPQNFATALINVSVAGRSAVALESFEPFKVVDRNSNTTFTLRLTNTGTAPDVFRFDPPRFQNATQQDAWGAQVMHQPEGGSRLVPVTDVRLDPGARKLIFLNVTAPLTAPLNSFADIDARVRPAGGAGTAFQVTVRAIVHEYGVEVRVPNATVNVVPGDRLTFKVNVTNSGNGPDTFDLSVDLGAVAGVWNASLDTRRVTLLNGSAVDVGLALKLPEIKLSAGAPVVVIVRSPQAESLGRTEATKTFTIQVNLLPYVADDVDDEGPEFWELAVDKNRNSADGFESFTDPHVNPLRSVSLYRTDGDRDGKADHLVDRDANGEADKYWDPDSGVLSPITFLPDLDKDGIREFLFDADGDFLIDRHYDPGDGTLHDAFQRDVDGDDNPEFLVDSDDDGAFDKYYDADVGTAGLVTDVERKAGVRDTYLIDTTGGGVPTKELDVSTGDVRDARIAGLGSFLEQYWYFIALFLAVVVLAAVVAARGRSR